MPSIDAIAEAAGYDLSVQINAGALRDTLIHARTQHHALRALIEELRASPWHLRPTDVADRLEALVQRTPVYAVDDYTLAERAFKQPNDRVAYAELKARDLIRPGMTTGDTYKRIAERNAP